MTANEFPLKKVPDLDDYDDEAIEAIRSEMERTRKAVAPNPVAQAIYPPLRPVKPRKR